MRGGLDVLSITDTGLVGRGGVNQRRLYDSFAERCRGVIAGPAGLR